jgi:hypothetical protein
MRIVGRLFLGRQGKVFNEWNVFSALSLAMRVKSKTPFLLGSSARHRFLELTFGLQRVDHRHVGIEQAIETIETVGEIVGMEPAIDHARASSNN